MTVHDTTKPMLREHYRELRRRFSHTQVKVKSQTITEKLKTILDWQKINSIHIYLPIERDNEVNTRFFIDWLKANHPHIRIYNPDNSRTLPNVDVVIVPIIAFDERGHRLGFGGGTYDRWLKDFNGKTIGLAYEDCRSHQPLPADSHDIKLGYIITETRLYNFN